MAGLRLNRVIRILRIFPICMALAALCTTKLLGSVQSISEPEISPADRGHWAFQPLQQAVPPPVANSSSVRTPIDAFLLQKLEAAGLRLLPEATPETLVRRLYFDLVGLPPSFEVVKQFALDSSPKAYEKLVDQLLASSAYGERWAQHWLDAVRFAESDGFEFDAERAEAWRYRDWVINALNQDLPYDQFLRFQIAGDLLESTSPGAKVATGFLLAGPDMPDINLKAERRHNVLNEMTSTVGSVFLGLGVGCAQCHDHKTDPISQADFYRLRAFFDQLEFPNKNKQLPSSFVESSERHPSYLMRRGAFDAPGAELQPEFLRVLDAQPGTQGPAPEQQKTQLNRIDLANWLTKENSPLVARVLVNRIWHHHFTQPLVETPNDFGLTTEQPLHHALLDWLAHQLTKNGWSLKKLHKTIVMSAAYRQQSTASADEWSKIKQVDPENALYSRMNRRRLTGETIRDTLLKAAGELNQKSHGPSIRPPLPPEVRSTLLKNQWNVTQDASQHTRRSIYVFARRNLKFPMFDVFDRPDALASCGRRNESTTAIQSLALLNSDLARQSSHWIAQRLRRENAAPDEQVRRCYRLLFSRDPRAHEVQLGLEFLNQQTSGTENLQAQELLADYCLALINSAEFIYID